MALAREVVAAMVARRSPRPARPVMGRAGRACASPLLRSPWGVAHNASTPG
jgi:hypothetical protein